MAKGASAESGWRRKTALAAASARSRRRVEIEKIKKIVCAGGVAIREYEIGVATRRFFQHLQRFQQRHSHIFSV